MNRLVDLQNWFGKMIAAPLQDNHQLSHGHQESALYIAPSPTLKPFERLQIYHQQYWWRLIKCLQTNFPTLLRLFGYEDFQKRIAVPYLYTHPPKDWALCKLGETLPHWLKKNYKEEDSYLVITAAEVDFAAQAAFWRKGLETARFASLTSQEILTQPLILQPFIHLFALKCDFLSFREAFLKNEPEYYNVNPFPQMHYGKSCFVLYRTPNNVVTWKKISSAEFWMLCQFKRKNTIERVCQKLEEKGDRFLNETLSQIPFWFKQWTVLEWFGSF